ncbi:phage tail protein [Lactococcus garvieae]|uniref:phage tail protein n=1 Tax=Lactococcus garvieae TaxID=1363 RepID=UPI0020CE76A8|nr:phage tail protein [Lactococcus garvieae]
MSPSTQVRAKMTKAQAEVFKEELTKVTKEKHYSTHNDQKSGHMADNIDFVNGEIDGTFTGNSVVGWNNAYHARNARRLNDGTKKYPADHFVDEVRESPEVQEKMMRAQQEVYEKQVKGEN